jgi:hypothetical protein
VGRPYANPYVAGVGLGLVLLAAFVLTGRGLGASGGFASSAAGLAKAVAPASAASSPFFSRYLTDDASPWLDWLVIELAGVVAGGFLSARLARRWRLAIDRGAGVSAPARLAAAAGGGFAMGAGAVLARGCTSGQALTGGAMLSVGSWLFIIAAFAGAYAFAPIVRRLWR